MSLTVAGVWEPGAWANTVWADGVWSETPYTAAGIYTTWKAIVVGAVFVNVNRIERIPFENRVLHVSVEDRVERIGSEDRTLRVLK